jgi:hypothetical protein
VDWLLYGVVALILAPIVYWLGDTIVEWVRTPRALPKAPEVDNPWAPVNPYEFTPQWKNIAAFALAEAAVTLQKLGFFDPQWRPHRLVPNLAAQYEQRWGAAFDVNDERREIKLAALDEKRVWWRDCEDNDDYVTVLKEWSAISRGAFMPENIRVEEGLVRFELAGKTRALAPQPNNGWLDLEALLQASDLLDGFMFVSVPTGGQHACVICVDPEEYVQLKRRRWPI